MTTGHEAATIRSRAWQELRVRRLILAVLVDAAQGADADPQAAERAGDLSEAVTEYACKATLALMRGDASASSEAMKKMDRLVFGYCWDSLVRLAMLRPEAWGTLPDDAQLPIRH